MNNSYIALEAWSLSSDSIYSFIHCNISFLEPHFLSGSSIVEMDFTKREQCFFVPSLWKYIAFRLYNIIPISNKKNKLLFLIHFSLI